MKMEEIVERAGREVENLQLATRDLRHAIADLRREREAMRQEPDARPPEAAEPVTSQEIPPELQEPEARPPEATEPAPSQDTSPEWREPETEEREAPETEVSGDTPDELWDTLAELWDTPTPETDSSEEPAPKPPPDLSLFFMLSHLEDDGPVRLDGVKLGLCEVMGLEIDEPEAGRLRRGAQRPRLPRSVAHQAAPAASWRVEGQAHRSPTGRPASRRRRPPPSPSSGC